MDETKNITEFYERVVSTLEEVTTALTTLRDEVTAIERLPWDAPLSKAEDKIMTRFLTSASLFQPNSEIRRKSWGTSGPSDFLYAMECFVRKLAAEQGGGKGGGGKGVRSL